MSRFVRQKNFAPLGDEGQRRLEQSRVLIVGCGALGGTVADLLVRAGVGQSGGCLTLMDPDIVQLDNLHRQTLFVERHAKESRFKVEAAREMLLSANESASLQTLVERFEETERCFHLVEAVDLLIDASDNFRARFVMNRAAVQADRAFITAGVSGASGQILSILPGRTPCLECLFDATSLSFSQQEHNAWPALLGPLPQFFASMQSLEALKILSGNTATINPSLWSVDLWSNHFSSMAIAKNPNCPVCARTTISNVYIPAH